MHISKLSILELVRLHENSRKVGFHVSQKIRKQLEADFVANRGNKRYTIVNDTISMTGTKRQTITTDNLRQLAKDFGVTLTEKFL